MRIVFFQEQLHRCEQCTLLHDCQLHRDYLASGRKPSSVLFECESFEPTRCHTLNEEIVAALQADAADPITCIECVHYAMSRDWEGPACGEGGPVGFDAPACGKFTVREDALEAYGLMFEGDEDDGVELPGPGAGDAEAASGAGDC